MGKQYYISLNAGLAKYREGVCKSKCNFAGLNARCAFSLVNKCECVNAAAFIFLSLESLAEKPHGL